MLFLIKSQNHLIKYSIMQFYHDAMHLKIYSVEFIILHLKI